MARPRKKKADTAQGSLLSLAKEQKEESLPEIPVEEQPYPLPEGWKWVRLGQLYQINPKNKTDDETLASFVPMEKIDADSKGTFSFSVHKWAEIKKGHTHFSDGDVAFAKISPCFENRKSMLVQGLKNSIGAGTTELIILRNSNIFQKFTFYLVSTEDFIKKGVQTYSGTVGQQRVNMDFVRNYPVPIPTIKTQKQIVHNIELIFNKLDKAKEKIQEVLYGFENRRASILHNAFSGDLTNKWREKNKKGISGWTVCKLADVASLQTGIMKGRKTSGATVLKPYLRVANVQDGYFNLSEIKEIEVEEEQVTRWLLQKKDVLFTEGGDFDKLGRGAVWEGQIPNCLHQNHVFAVRVNQGLLDPYFLSYQAGSPYGKQYFLSCSKQTTNLASINSTQLKKFPVRLPSLLEQQEIVRILDDLLAKEQQIKDTAEAVLAQIELLKKSILARAFRGELC